MAPRAGPARSSFLEVALIVVAIGLAARWWSRFQIGVLTTQDTFDYFDLARQIAESDWSSPRLGGVRLPGYPAFLAGLGWIVRISADSLLAAHQLLGLAAALGFALAAWRVLGRGAALATGLLAAIHPGLLFLEHTAMSETLFAASLAATLASSRLAVATPHRLLAGLLLGLVGAASLLVRANGVAFLALLFLGGLHGAWPWPGSPQSSRAPRRVALVYAVGIATGFGLLLGPWLVRQHAVFGRARLTDFDETALVYLAQHRLLDPSLPAYKQWRGSYDPSRPETIYLDVARLVRASPRPRSPKLLDPLAIVFESTFETGDFRGWDSEPRLAVAAQRRELYARAIPARFSRGETSRYSTGILVAEQFRNRGEELWRARRDSLLAFLGFAQRGSHAPWGQDDLRFWLDSAARRPENLRSVNGDRLADLLPGTETTIRGSGLELWRSANLVYLDWLRPALALALLALLLRRLVVSVPRPHPALFPLAAGWIGTALLHGALLAGYERFAIPFDPVLLLAVLLAGRGKVMN